MADPVVLQDHTPVGVESTFYEVRVPVDPQCWPVKICDPIFIDGIVNTAPVLSTREKAWLLVVASVTGNATLRDDRSWRIAFNEAILRAEEFDAIP